MLPKGQTRITQSCVWNPQHDFTIRLVSISWQANRKYTTYFGLDEITKCMVYCRKRAWILNHFALVVILILVNMYFNNIKTCVLHIVCEFNKACLSLLLLFWAFCDSAVTLYFHMLAIRLILVSELLRE